MNEFGIYVHIPFCKQKCYYCDFISFSGKEQLIEKYMNALKEEIKIKSENLKNKKITTIYIGGGTPSIVDAKFIKEALDEIKEKYDVDENCEITIEVNPGTVTKEKLKLYKEAGINRLSIGLQSTNNKLLKQIGRIHDFEDFLETYKIARNIGFKNINVDLMLALPNQTIKDLEESVKNIIKINPEHVSVYSLIIEEGTKLEQMLNKNKIELIEDEEERKMYWKVKELLEKNNYKHYEISNFAKKGFESKHNMNCWNQEEYIGFGLASHSYINKERFCNISNLEKYIKNIENKNFKQNIIINEKQTKEDQKKEYMMLGLRRIEGVSIQKFKNKFVENPVFKYYKELEKLTKKNLIEIDEDKIKLTQKGLDLANIVWEEFI